MAALSRRPACSQGIVPRRRASDCAAAADPIPYTLTCINPLFGHAQRHVCSGGGGSSQATGVFAAGRGAAAGSYQEAVERLQAEQDGAAALHALEHAVRG